MRSRDLRLRGANAQTRSRLAEGIARLLTFVNANDWMLRKRLAEALGNLPDSQTQAALNYLQQDSHPLVAEAAKHSLQKLTKLL
ncbi:PBS lyase HEAT-like repeat protein [Calothrix sp. NIES-2100]|uniref:hypothetical protein n=1 Tax=Calothrix sp. NIES-2100 TaxID=1954172 RepID=UPI000B5F9B59|nr:PBS lyase HEAT-like repeat protein [Calothrix sp. NIES-2100]